MVEAGVEAGEDTKEKAEDDTLCAEVNTAIHMATVQTTVHNVRLQELVTKTMLTSPT